VATDVPGYFCDPQSLANAARTKTQSALTKSNTTSHGRGICNTGYFLKSRKLGESQDLMKTALESLDRRPWISNSLPINFRQCCVDRLSR